MYLLKGCYRGSEKQGFQAAFVCVYEKNHTEWGLASPQAFKEDSI